MPFAALFAVSPTAANVSWNGATDAVWSTGGNWVGGVAPVTSDVAVFDAGSSANLTTALGADFSIQGLRITTPGGLITIGAGNLLTLGAGGIDMSAASQNLLLNALVALGVDQSWNVTNGRTLTANGIISGTNVNLNKIGLGDLILGGANTFTGTTMIGGGTLTLNGSLNGTTGTDLTFTGSGVFNLSAASGVSQGMKVLRFSGGDGTVRSTHNGGTSTVSFTSRAARTAGATGNFTLINGTQGAGGSNNITIGGELTGQLLDRGLFYNGSQYAAYDAGGFVRGLIYGTDADAPASVPSGATLGVDDATQNVEISGNITAQTTASVNTIRDPGAFSITLAGGQTLSFNGFLKSGGNAATISGGNGITTTAGGNEMVVRTDAAGDTLTISTPILANGTSSLTKSGDGILTLTAASTYTGKTYVNAGTLFLNALTTIQNTAGIVIAPSAKLETGNFAGISLAKLNPANGGSGAVAGSILSIHQRPNTDNPGTIYGTLLWDSSNNGFDWNNTFIPDLGQGAILQSTGAARSWQANITFSGDATIDSGPNQFNGNNNQFFASTAGLKTLTLTGAQKVVLSAINDSAGRMAVVWNNSNTSANANQYNNASNFSGGTLIRQGVVFSNGTGVGTANGAFIAFGPDSANTTQFYFNSNLTLIGLNTDPASPGAPVVAPDNNARILTINNPVPNTYAGTLQNTGAAGSGTLTITKGGPGTLTLSGATRTYTGGTNVNGGTLLWSSGVDLPTTGTLAVGGTGNFSLADGTARNIAAATLTIASGATLTFDWNGGVVDNLAPTAAVTPAANATVGISINPANTPTGSSLALLTGVAGSTLNNPNYFLANNTNYTATLTKSATSLTIGNYASAASLNSAYWLGGKVTNALGAMALSTGGTTLTSSNWAVAAGDTTATANGLVPGAGTDVFFSTNTGATQQASVVLGADMSVKSLTFKDSTAVTIGGGNFLTLGSGGITITATSAATTTINAGVFIGASQTWNIPSGKQLTMAGVLAGANNNLQFASTNSLTLTGGGTLLLSGNSNTYTGAITVSNSTAGTLLKFGAAGAIGAGTGSALNVGSITISGSGAALDLNGQGLNANTQTFSEILTLNGTGIASGGSLMNSANGNGTYPGPLALGSSSTIVAGTGGNTNANIILSNTSAITGSGFDLTLSGVGNGSSIAGAISTGAGRVTKSGTGSWSFNNTGGTYTGQTVIQSGNLSAISIKNVGAVASALGAPISVANGTIDIGTSTAAGQLTYTGTGDITDRVINLAGTTFGATLDQSGTGTLTFTSAITATGLGNKTLTLQGSTAGRGEISSTLTDTGGNIITLAKAGSGSWKLSGVNTYSGGTTLTGGTIQVGVGNVGSVGAITSSAVGIGGLTFNGGGISSDGVTPRTILNAITFTGSGTLGDAINNGLLTFSAATSLGNAVRTLTLNSDAQFDGIISGTGGGISKAGTGTLTLTANNSYTGLTTVNAGRLVLTGNNSAATGGMSLLGGVTQFNSPANINGTTRNVTVTAPGVVLFAPSFDTNAGADIAAALTNRIVATSTGVIAADNYAGTSMDFNAAGLTAASLGAIGTVTFTGTLTPGSNTYRLGGGGGTLIFTPAAGTFDTSNNLVVNGNGNTGIVDFGGLTKTFGAVTFGGGTARNGTINGTSFTNAAGAVIEVNLSGVGLFTVAGTLTLNGNNSAHSGGYSIGSGTTLIGVSLGTGPITLGGGTLSPKNDGSGNSKVESISYGNNITVSANSTINVDRLTNSGNGIFLNAQNKTLQFGTLGIGAQKLTVNNSNGFGLEFTGTTTMSGAPNFEVNGGNNTPVVQGLNLSGKVTGAFGFTKSNGGTLVLANAANDFGSASTISVTGGLLSVRADGALGALNNIISLSGGGLQANGTFTTARQINTTGASTIDVTQGTVGDSLNIFTLTTPFNNGAASGSALAKNGNGIFEVNADNNGATPYTGVITINAGAIRVYHCPHGIG